MEENQVIMPFSGKSEPSVTQPYRLTDLPALEDARRSGPLRFWESLIIADPTATFFQGPAWCMEWYRAYQDLFQPLVQFIVRGDTLIGIIPLATEISTGRLAFAGDNLSDYRDIVALPEYRQVVVAELLRLYRSEIFPNPLRIGPTQPESKTVEMILGQSGGESGTWSIGRSHPCWRLLFGTEIITKKLTSKESIRRNLSYYKRQGPVSLKRIEEYEEWDNIKHEFFMQHSLRQLQAGRPISFNDPHKVALHDALLRDHPSDVQISALRVGERYIAYHYGCLWKDMLYWGAPAFDIKEEKHSPGQILLALLLQEAEASGLRGVDFTLGTEEFKQRFGNSLVNLPSVEVYSHARQQRARKLRDKTVTGAKLVVGKVAGAKRWNDIAKLGESAASKAEKVRKLGLKSSLSKLAHRGLKGIKKGGKVLIFIATPADVVEIPPKVAVGETYSFRSNEIGDMLKYEGNLTETAEEIAEVVKSASESIRNGHTLHTVLINDRLAGWIWSYWPQGPTFMTESQTFLDVRPRSVSLYAAYMVPDFRGRKLYQALLSRVLLDRFAEGAECGYGFCLDTNIASRKAIERIGYRLAEVHEFSQFLRWKRTRQWQESNIAHS